MEKKSALKAFGIEETDTHIAHVVLAMEGENLPAFQAALKKAGKKKLANLRTKAGQTLLHYATTLDRGDAFMPDLLNIDIDPSIRDKAGDTAWDLALENGWEDTASLLKEKTNQKSLSAFSASSLAEWKKQTNYPFPLHMAARQGAFSDLVRVTVSKKEFFSLEDLLKRDDRGDSVPDILIRNGQIADLFYPPLWAGRLLDKERIWQALPHPAREGLDYKKLSTETRTLTLRKNLARHRPR